MLVSHFHTKLNHHSRMTSIGMSGGSDWIVPLPVFASCRTFASWPLTAVLLGHVAAPNGSGGSKSISITTLFGKASVSPSLIRYTRLCSWYVSMRLPHLYELSRIAPSIQVGTISETYFVYTALCATVNPHVLQLHLQDANPLPLNPMDSLPSWYPYYSYPYIFLSSLSSYARAIPEYTAGLSRPPVNVYQKLCLSEWTLTSFPTPAFLTACSNILCAVLGAIIHNLAHP